MVVGGQCHTVIALSSGNTPNTHFTGDCLGSRVSVEGCGKTRSSLGLDP